MIISNLIQTSGARQSKIMFVVTTPFAVNAFLTAHIQTLARDFDITLCTNTEAYELSSEVAEIVTVIHVPFSRQIALFRDLRSLLILMTKIFMVKPVSVHSITPKAGLLAMIAGFALRVPSRWHTYTGQVWATRTGIYRRFLRSLDLLIMRFSTQVFVDSSSQRAFLQREGFLSKEIGLLGEGSISGVDLSRFQPDIALRQNLRNQLGIGPNIFVFLFVGRLAKDKGVFDLIEAFKLLNEQEAGTELLVVGPDEDDLASELKELTVGYEGQIHWLGATRTPQIYMAAADVLVLPSHREGFGSVLIEGAACGIPAVAYRIEGVIDAVVDGESGLLVEKGDVPGFASAMLVLSQNEALRIRLGERALDRAKRDFNSETVTNAWVTFYKQALIEVLPEKSIES